MEFATTLPGHIIHSVHDIGYRVIGSNLMEVDHGDRLVMGLCLSLGKKAVYLLHPCPVFIGKLQGIYEGIDL